MPRKKKNTLPTRPSGHLKWSKLVKERDNYVCQDCGSINKRSLQAHHIKSWANFPYLRYNIDNGKTVCVKCHAKYHPEMKKIILGKRKKRIKRVNKTIGFLIKGGEYRMAKKGGCKGGKGGKGGK